MKNWLLPFCFYFCSSQAFTQSPSESNHATVYQVGYKNIIVTDSSRMYKPNTNPGNHLHFRPVEIDCWYPAADSGMSAALPFGYFLDLLQARSNRFQDDTVFTTITTGTIGYLNAGLNIRDSTKLIQVPTNSHLNANPFPKRFPLILYFCSYNGMSFENIDLFGKLASHGFVVACVTSVGVYPGNMSMHVDDLMEQVNDGAFTNRVLKNEANIDTAEIGAMGYSWGGLAAVILAMNEPGIKSVLSFDGSESHYYGDTKEEDEEFDLIYKMPAWKIRNMNMPYAYLESGFKQTDANWDSVNNVLTLPGKKHLYLRFPKATHADFSALPDMAHRINNGAPPQSDLYLQFEKTAILFFDSYLSGSKNQLYPFIDSLLNSGIADTLYPKIKIKKPDIQIKGVVIDEKTKESLAFVNIGIRNKNTGTVSGTEGYFQMNIDQDLMKDSLTFSMAGYQTYTISLSDFLKMSKPYRISLREKISNLNEVVITSRVHKTETLGNTTTSNFVSVGLPLKFLGSETGIKLHLGKKPVLFKSFSFNISENRLDTALFRLNIYSIQNGAPFENILHQNILVPVGKQKGKYTLNLSKYNLMLDGDLLISLEWIQGSSTGKNNGAIFLSAGFLNSNTWHRLTSQAEWKKAPGLGVGFNVLVQRP